MCGCSILLGVLCPVTDPESGSITQGIERGGDQGFGSQRTQACAYFRTAGSSTIYEYKVQYVQPEKLVLLILKVKPMSSILEPPSRAFLKA